MPRPLNDAEVREFAKLYPPGADTTGALRKAGFDVTELPAVVAGQAPLQYWDLVNAALADGAVRDGRARLLAMAGGRYPYNEVLFGRRPPAVWRMLLLGAGPEDAGPGTVAREAVRSDREYRAMSDANDAIDINYRPFATVDDLRHVRTVQPHLLHLACHGDGPRLIFHDRHDPAAATVVHAADVARLLMTYERDSGERLYAIVVNACRSAESAELLAPCADVVVGHRDDLTDRDAVTFAAALAAALRGAGSFASAVREAQDMLPLPDAERRQIVEGLVVIG